MRSDLFVRRNIHLEVLVCFSLCKTLFKNYDLFEFLLILDSPSTLGRSFSKTRIIIEHIW